MTVLIISSKLDPASINIRDTLLELSSWKKIDTFYNNPVYQHTEMEDIIQVTIKDRKIFHENLDKEIEEKLKIKPKLAIFISRHSSKTGKPTLTVHPLGNYGDAKFGGKPKTLVKSSPRLMTQLLRLMKKYLKQTKLNYPLCFEVTHHGPYLETPTVFVEIGSTEKEWSQKEPAQIIAKSLTELLMNYHYEEDLPTDIPVLLGIGGGHYAPRFTDVAFEKKAAFGHMIPTYHIDSGNINEEIIQQAIQETPNFKAVYFHRKALRKSQVTEYKEILKKLDVPVISSNDLSSLD